MLANVIESGFKATSTRLTLKPPRSMDTKAYPSVLDTPEVPDLGVWYPTKIVPGALRECASGRSAVGIITAGFRESGKEGVERAESSRSPKSTASAHCPKRARHIHTFTPINATFRAGTPPQGSIAFMSQSGALPNRDPRLSLAQQILALAVRQPRQQGRHQ